METTPISKAKTQSSMKRFFIKLSAIIDGKRQILNSETASGDIHWLSYTLKTFYGIDLSYSQLRYYAKKRTQFLTNKSVNLNYGSVSSGLPKSLGKRDELLVQIF